MFTTDEQLAINSIDNDTTINAFPNGQDDESDDGDSSDFPLPSDDDGGN